MPALIVERSVTVHAPIDRVFAVARDFRQAPAWSPWLIADPACEVGFADDNSRYSWEGRFVGRGELALADEDPLRRIRHHLTFHKPWKSTARVEMAFSPRPGGDTAVTWTMHGSLPFLFFFMRRMMTAVIGMDYERGLAMLKDLAETGAVPSRLEFPGVQRIPGTRYVGIRRRCRIDEVGARMNEAFGELRHLVGDRRPVPSATRDPFAAYHAWDVVSRTTEFTAAVPVEETPPDLPPTVTAGERPPCDAYVVRHIGEYRHLGNAWSAGMMHGRAKAFRQDRKIDPFEIYASDPIGSATPTTAADPVTLVHFPVR